METKSHDVRSERRTPVRSMPELLVDGATGPPITLFRGGESSPYILSRDELISRGAQLARHFRVRGMEPEDRVLLLLPTDLAFLTSLTALWFNGAVSVPLDHRSTTKTHAMWVRKVRRVLSISKARFVVGTDEALASIRTLTETSSGASRGGEPVLISEREVMELSTRNGEPALPALPDSNAWAHCQFTSGSTGDPKGIMVRHGHIVANLEASAERMGVRKDADRFLSWLPLHHDMGFIGGLLFPLHQQIPQVLLPTESFARAPHRWLQLISDYRISLSPAPTFAYELLVARVSESRLRGLDLSSWRYAWVGAEPVFAKTLEGFRARFRRFGLRERVLAPCYGLAEATLAVSLTAPAAGESIAWVKRSALQSEGVVERGRKGDADSIPIVGAGRPLSWAETKLVNDEGEIVDEGYEGRILIRGDCVCRTRLLDEGTVETESWLDTGDLGFCMDSELFITGRAKDLLIRGGVNTHPHWVEQVAEADPEVRAGRSAAVSLFRHEEQREEIVLVVEPAGYPRADQAGLKLRIAARVAAEVGLQLDRVECVPPGTVPKTSSGKVQRRLTATLLRDDVLSPVRSRCGERAGSRE